MEEIYGCSNVLVGTCCVPLDTVLIDRSPAESCSTMSQMQFLSRDGLPRLAYHKLSGWGPGIMYLPGYKSDMNNEKCLALEKYCSSVGRAFVRFDYRGCGQSEGNFEDSLLGEWKEDVLAVLDGLTNGPQMLVGSSMGSWLMFLVTLDRPQRVAGLISTGTPFDPFVNMYQSMSAEVKEEVARNGFFNLPSSQSTTGYYRIGYSFFQEAQKHTITQRPIPIKCPIRMLHGMDDTSVPWSKAVQLAENLESRDVTVVLRTQGGHVLKDEDSLSQLMSLVRELTDTIATSKKPLS
ncbi:palmitoyl-protein thioesterase ABHD10, mitochondrial-like [Pleurodeles waltl]|uniref:palmitoyl-protein thioesterase ABHD10, mitochondrial-like n=1 Tax=Pleurodeles waltl TaxID=8319 RepID=UPI0037099A6D